MKSNPLEDTFNFMKSLGFYPQYNSYKEYCRKEQGIGQTKEEHTQDYLRWKADMPPKERADYNFALED